MSTQSVKENNGSLNPALPPEVMSVGSTVTDIRKSWLSSAFSLIADKYRETRASPAPKRQKQNLSWPAASFILLQVVIGIPLLPYALLHWNPENQLRFACFFGVALAASLFKVRLPGIEATMSPNFLFILVGILDLSFPETLLMGCFGGLIQTMWQSKPRPRFIQVIFNFANLAISITAANFVFHSEFAYRHGVRWPLLLA